MVVRVKRFVESESLLHHRRWLKVAGVTVVFALAAYWSWWFFSLPSGVHVEIVNQTSVAQNDIILRDRFGRLARFDQIGPGRTVGLYVPRRAMRELSLSYEQPDGRRAVDRVGFPPLNDLLMGSHVRLNIMRDLANPKRNALNVQRTKFYAKLSD